MIDGKILFLYNSRSGRGHSSSFSERICAILSSGGAEVTAARIDFGRNPFDSAGDIDTVVVAGGDGTVNYVVNCMEARALDLVIGVIPAGTANDFAHALGMSDHAVAAARQIVGGTVRRVDCGRVNGRRFVNICSFGLFTTTSQHTPDIRKHILGRFAYLTEGLKELRRMHGIPIHVRTEYEEFDTVSFMTLVFNGTTAGGFRLARRASLQDGLLDCLILEKCSFASSARAMLCHLACGSSGHVRQIRANRIEITSPLDERTDVDGQRGPDFPLCIECCGGSLRVITGN